ncbi:helix-turn-helix transcriptional regulator [bacterium SCSIO 12741]|nr:helix-turn-helix transcriptional regulator [bacterium SCSIO 12741]
MKSDIQRVTTLSEAHQKLGYPKPVHPLISWLDLSHFEVTEDQVGSKTAVDLYMVSVKDKSCGIEYGRNSFDFAEGVLVFSAPGQVYTNHSPVKKGDLNGWLLHFHPDLIRNTHLADIIDEYSFFNYDVYEALHLSEEEEQVITDCVEKIKNEYEQRIDNHSQRVIVSNLELLLNYSLRFYERQFNTRTSQHKDVVTQFEKDLKAYYKQGNRSRLVTPSIQEFAEKANLSQHYFSDLIKKETGRAPKDHINDFLIERAKNMLLGTELSVSEIAYDLGFNYPHYFTRVFKSKTGQTPVQYRSMN